MELAIKVTKEILCAGADVFECTDSEYADSESGYNSIAAVKEIFEAMVADPEGRNSQNSLAHVHLDFEC